MHSPCLHRHLDFTPCDCCSPFLVGGRDLEILVSAPLIVGGRDPKIRSSAPLIVEGDVLTYVCMALYHHMLKERSSTHDDNLQSFLHRPRNNNSEPYGRLSMVWKKRERTNGYRVWFYSSALLPQPRLCDRKWIRKKKMEFLLFLKFIHFAKSIRLSSRMTISSKLN